MTYGKLLIGSSHGKDTEDTVSASPEKGGKNLGPFSGAITEHLRLHNFI